MKTKKFLSMAALALVGAVMTGCSSDDNTIDTPQPENGLVLKTTISLDGGAGTRALTAAGVKTFAVDDQVVLFYVDGKGISRRVLSSALTAPDISADGKTANLTFDVSASLPATNGAIRYVYPANMASTNQDSSFDLDDENTIDFTQLDDQKGTLDDLGALDLATFDGNFSGTSLPASATLTNRLAILAITLTDNAATPAEITSSITDLVVVEGANHYAVTRAAAAGPIYVAIKPTSSAVIEVAATDGPNEYGKFLTSKTYAANNGYNVSWKMLPCVNLNNKGAGTFTYDVQEDMIITGTPEESGFRINLPNKECTVTLADVDPTGSKSVSLNGNVGKAMTVKLKGTSRLFELGNGSGASVTIDAVEPGGTVIVTKPYNPLSGGPFIINGGTVKAKATAAYYAVYGNLEVNGGAVYLAGHEYSSTEYPAVSGTITGTLYGWDGSAWGAVTSGTSSAAQYITTDNTSGDPTAWTW